MATEMELPENEENKTLSEEQNVQGKAETDTSSTKEPVEEVQDTAETQVETHESDDEQNHEDEQEYMEDEPELTLSETISEMEKIVNQKDAGAFGRKFSTLKDSALSKINEETEDKKHDFIEAGNAAEEFVFWHPAMEKINVLSKIFHEKHHEYSKKQEAEHADNLTKREQIIEDLKNLYTQSEPGTNLFKAIRDIKEEWKNAGQVAKSTFRNLNNNYFFHLNQFYEMLDLNKEYLEQEYSHNLDKRKQIIDRAKELESEPLVQKALNELQYLHKLWKEEAGPVAEEFRDSTWEEFREISNKIHERKTELATVLEAEKTANLEKKNKIIEEIKNIAASEKTQNHNFWQQAIKKIEELRNEFLKTGSVPKKLSTQNWNDFKQTLRDFNSAKNNFYKSLKNSQVHNLEEKKNLITVARDNMNSEDWETTVPLFKKLQEDWKKIGHVPKSQANQIWDEFREACKTFFNNYRDKNNAAGDNWKENYKHKKALLDELKTVTNDDGSVEKIESIKTAWNNIGKVPRDKISINTEFNKTLREKLKLNKINEFELKEEGLSESQLTDKARKMKNQIADLETEITTLENNLGFFSNPSRENPLLKDTYEKIDEKKSQLESMKESLHNIISGD